MPRRTDIRSICLIGSGPIVIGQACEFDYAGCQALKVLREDGFRTVVVNSNPATIMTDPGFADATYLEPLDLAGVADVLGRERPDALLPTLGGQTALNLAIELAEEGVLDALGVELLGAPVDVIRRAEDRELFREAVQSCGLAVPRSRIVTSLGDLPGVAVPAVVQPVHRVVPFVDGPVCGPACRTRLTHRHHRRPRGIGGLCDRDNHQRSRCWAGSGCVGRRTDGYAARRRVSAQSSKLLRCAHAQRDTRVRWRSQRGTS